MFNPVINRKTKLRGALAALMLVCAGTAHAELKVAVLDTQRALLESEEAQSLMEKAREELQKEQTDVNALGEEIQKLRDQLAKDAEVMSASAQRKAQQDIDDKRLDYQFKVNKLQKELQDRQQDLFEQLVPKLNAVLKDLVALEGYDLIMEHNSLRYVAPQRDITRRVTEKLNEKRDKD